VGAASPSAPTAMAPSSATGKLAKLDNGTWHPRIAAFPDEYKSRNKTYTGMFFSQDDSISLFVVYDPDKNEGLSLIEKNDKSGGREDYIICFYLDPNYNNLWWEGRMRFLSSSPATDALPRIGKITYNKDLASLTLTRGSEVISLLENSPANSSELATTYSGLSTNNDPLNPTPLDWSGTSNPYQGKIEGSVGGSDKADYFVFKVPAGQQLTGITLSSYTSTDPKAFIGVQKGAQVTASSSNPGPLIGYTHFGNSQGESVVGTNIINKLGGALTEGTYSIWIQQLGAKTDYSFIVDLEKVKNNSENSTPTYNVSNTYAKNLVGDVLTGAPKLTQNTFDAKFYNLGGGRYGVQQKGKSTIDEITGISNLSFNDKTVSVSSDIKGVFDQVTGKETKDAQMYRLYNAAFARFPDASGLRYWINEYTRGITDYRNIAQSFLNSEEFKTRYGANNSNTDFINNMYRNILGRLPDEEGRNYWVTNLDTGRDTRVNVLGGFAESTENKNLFSQVTGFS